jgi:hypothetical protein
MKKEQKDGEDNRRILEANNQEAICHDMNTQEDRR